MKNDQVGELGLLDIVKIIRKRFYIIIAVTLSAVIISAAYSFYIAKPIYEAKTSIIIGNNVNENGREFQYSDLMLYQNLVKTYCSIVKTTVVAEKTIERLGIGMTPEELQGRITSTPQEGTQMMDIKVKGYSPDEVVNIINALSTVFIEEARAINQSSYVQVIDKVKTPTVPVSPNKKANLVYAFLVGFMLSITIIFVLEYMDNSVRTQEDIEKYTSLPVLGLIPREKGRFDSVSHRILNNTHHSQMEAFRTLRTNIDFTSISENIKAIIVTSSMAGEGKSTTASVLAAVMAQSGKKVLLMDCDFRKSRIHQLFDISNSQGITNMLITDNKSEEYIFKSDIENLYILPAGTRPPNPTALLSTTKMKQLISKFKNDFDYIIIDTPPVGLVTDAQLLAQITDGCLMVVAAGESEKKVLAKSKGLLEHVNARILGVSLNKVTETKVYGAGYYGEEKKVKRQRKKVKSVLER
jgi:polysaccharide biosynthesis transport protein